MKKKRQVLLIPVYICCINILNVRVNSNCLCKNSLDGPSHAGAAFCIAREGDTVSSAAAREGCSQSGHNLPLMWDMSAFKPHPLIYNFHEDYFHVMFNEVAHRTDACQLT